MNTHTGLTSSVLLLAFGMSSLAMQVENDYMGGARVTVKDETVTASRINEKTPSKTYYRGIRELKLISSANETVLSLDEALGAAYVSFQPNPNYELCLEAVNERGCLTLTDTGGAYIIGQDTHITVRLNPATPPIDDISWLIYDATLQPQRVRMLNDSPFVLECALPGYTNRGIVSSADDLNAGEVGLVLGNLNKPTGTTMYTFDTITVVALAMDIPTPEPATGTLTLLALAGLCIRRRRK